MDWKKLLDTIESSNDKLDIHVINELSKLFEHLSPQPALRLQKEYESNTLRSIKLLGDLFDRVDLSDRKLLSSLLLMLRSFGYFRVAQITYYIDRPRDSNEDDDPIFYPKIEKSKWYNLCPLLPEAGTIGWKGILNHGLVKEEKKLFKVCQQLLTQKIHFYSILLLQNRYSGSESLLKRNGEKVAEKLFELIKDVAYGEESMIGLDSSLFNLLIPFTRDDQQVEIVDAAVQDLFKPFSLQKPVGDDGLNNIYELIRDCLMPKAHLQNLFFTLLINHLKCNIIRRSKRRHSSESDPENGISTLEGLIDAINSDDKLIDTLSKSKDVEVSAKTLQISYINYWIDVVKRIIPLKILNPNASLKLLGLSTMILLTASEKIHQELIDKLCLMIVSVLDNTSLSGSNKLFSSCDPKFLIMLTSIFAHNPHFVTKSGIAMQQVYAMYINLYMKHLLFRSSKTDTEKLAEYVAYICDKTIDKNATHLLQYIFMHELANCSENLKSKASTTKMLETYSESSKSCGRGLHKFIKRNISLNFDLTHDEVEEMDVCEGGGDNGIHDVTGFQRSYVVDALVCVLKVAIGRKDQETLDSYSDLLLKIYGLMAKRFEKLNSIVKTNSSDNTNPIDLHLPKLLNLYVEQREMIKAYLNYDIVGKLAISLIEESATQMNGTSDESIKSNKKAMYNQIKSKLENIIERAGNSQDVYPNIINKQFNSVIELSVSSASDIECETSCCEGCRDQMGIFYDIAKITLSNCGFDLYKKILIVCIQGLEKCDPLDHPKTLYFFILLESLIASIPKQHSTAKESQPMEAFREMLPQLSCNIIRISKSVELGPSIHAFTKSGSHKTSKGVQCCTYSNCIKVYTLIFLRFPPKVTNTMITDAMQICVSSNMMLYAKLSNRLPKSFVQLASAVARLLHSTCIGRKEEEVIDSSMPIFLVVLSHLIRCIILAAPQMIDNQTTSFKNQLELLAIDTGRTLNNLSFLKVKLVDFAPHLISTYIKDIQRASCPNFVRLHLNEGIFRIFNLVDAHQKERQEKVLDEGVQRKTTAGRASGSLFEMIHTRLDQASREIFKDLHDNYNRFHRYLGKC